MVVEPTGRGPHETDSGVDRVSRGEGGRRVATTGGVRAGGTATTADAEFTEFVAGAVDPALPHGVPAGRLARPRRGPGADRTHQGVRRVVAGPPGRRPGGLRARRTDQDVPLGRAGGAAASCRSASTGTAAAPARPRRPAGPVGGAGRLAPVDRAVVVLRYWEDRSVAQTAADLGLSEAAVKNRSLRALRALRGAAQPTTPRPNGSHDDDHRRAHPRRRRPERS